MLFIILANTIIPLSIDMYTPAVPSLPGYFGTSEQMVNFTLMGFFLFMTMASLLFGPVSDRFGRKPLLVGSLITYTGGSILCALAASIIALIAARLIQAIGAGALMAVSTALVKGCFIERRREQMLSIIQVLSVVGPVIAPLIGGILLQYFDWHASFIFLAVFGAICLALASLFEESLPVEERSTGGIQHDRSGHHAEKHDARRTRVRRAFDNRVCERYSPHAARRASTLSVFSHVNSGSSRPK